VSFNSNTTRVTSGAETANMGIGMRKSIYHIIHTNSNKSVEQSKFIDNNNKQILLKISHLSQNITIKIHLLSLFPDVDF
jgi:hypothetical protein